MLRKIFYFLGAILGLLLLVLFFYAKSDIDVEQLKLKYTNQESEFVDIAGMQVHYRDEGAGETLVLLHGTSSSLHTWEAWAQKLKKSFRVIRLDLPAFGLTGPHPQRDYTIQSYVAFVHSFLQKLNIESCYMAGNSLGGLITWEYALAYPNQVKKMILLDAAGYPNTRPRPWVFRLANVPVLNQIVRYVTPKFFFKNNLAQVYADDSQITDDLINRYFELNLRTGNRQAFIDRAQIQQESNWRKIKQIKAPTLILWGKEDTWTPVSFAHRFKADLAQAELKIYDQVGHIPMEEQPELTLKDALVFLLKK
ncbi:MAG: alpha/beta hydrolase [Microscillaceae bacterium]|jgi:pimeloyl-ACP methyl ester carboxylesterase|nr:alpha/beta hydrolase [Microscillaceae bacterium]